MLLLPQTATKLRKGEIRMEQIDWDSVKFKVNDMLDADSEINAIPSDVVSLARMLLDTGDNNASTRESLTTSIRGMLKPYPGYPWKRGNQGSLPAAARAVVDTACEEIRSAAHAFFSGTLTYSQPLLRKHGKAKGSPVYVDADEYANTLAKKARQNATALFKSGEWDGTLSGLSACSAYEFVEEEE
tara:strand:- start:442 stop:999 length:558 start_codon:yes stop_codon:yes gene_type:complete